MRGGSIPAADSSPVTLALCPLTTVVATASSSLQIPDSLSSPYPVNPRCHGLTAGGSGSDRRDHHLYTASPLPSPTQPAIPPSRSPCAASSSPASRRHNPDLPRSNCVLPLCPVCCHLLRRELVGAAVLRIGLIHLFLSQIRSNDAAVPIPKPIS